MKTNRSHFSWSQYNLWHSSKYSFYKKYCLGENDFTSPHLEKGKEFSEYRDTGLVNSNIDSTLLESVSKAIPPIGKTEFKAEFDFEGQKLLSYIDEVKRDLSEFNEYKTGKNPWTKKDVENHKQLDFYAFLLYCITGKIPKCTLYWIETEEIEINGEKKLAYTGHVQAFRKQFTEDDIVNMGVSINLTLAAIEAYEFEEIEINEEEGEAYIELLDKIKELTDQANLIKFNIINEMRELNVSRATSKYGTFTLSKRKNYIFSKELTDKKQKYKDEIDKLEAQEKKDPKTKINYTESISFRRAKKN